MSVAAVAKVWDRSKAKGGELLVLLAIADYAHDDGRDAWPTIEKLAAKSRMSDRGVRDILQRLVAAGEIAIEKNIDGRRVKRGYCPRQFIHVLCCVDEPAKIAGSQAAKIAGSVPLVDDVGAAHEPAKIAGSQAAKIAASGERRTGRTPYDEPAESRTALKEDPSGIRQYKSTPRAREGSRPHPLDEAPEPIAPWSLELFEQLFAVYPRKDREVAARRAWIALNPPRDLAEFIVAHIQARLKCGWARDTELRFIPTLCRFLDEQRWQERYAERPSVPSRASPDSLPEGTRVARTCERCGNGIDGRVRNGERVYEPCATCARAEGVA